MFPSEALFGASRAHCSLNDHLSILTDKLEMRKEIIVFIGSIKNDVTQNLTSTFFLVLFINLLKHKC